MGIIENLNMFFIKLLFTASILCLRECYGLERDLTINVDPGKTDCFYQNVLTGQIIDVEYQVIDGGQGGLDVGFLVVGPNNKVLAAPGRRQSGSHREAVLDTGDYKFCFDNSHSKFNAKTVYFDFMIDSDENDDSNEEEDMSNKSDDKNDSEHVISEWHDRLNVLIGRLHQNLVGAKRLQDAVSVTAARDLHNAERSHWRVAVCSAIQAIVMLMVGALQVIMVRSLFDETSRVHFILKKIPVGPS